MITTYETAAKRIGSRLRPDWTPTEVGRRIPSLQSLQPDVPLSEEENAGLERIRLEFERQLALRGEQPRQPRAEMSAVLYARVSAEPKAAIEVFAGAHGRAVAAAVAELLSRGL